MTASRFNGSVCLVTGSALGIGLATARRLAEEGATVFGLDVREPSQDLPGVTPLIGDVTSLESWQDALRATAGAGPLDVLVNNAGATGSHETITGITLEDWEQVVRLNQTSVFYGMRTVLPGMIERRRGAVVNVSSMWGIIGTSGVAAYQASKGAVTMMTKNAAATYAADGVRINSVHPGLIITAMTKDQDPSISDRLITATPLGRAGEASEVAAAIAFLASDDASFITGAQLLVDGGFTTV
jgi:NAD(P)-dependent dehydrogenase (short-subunit alcohol dehydrogenase family)